MSIEDGFNAIRSVFKEQYKTFGICTRCKVPLNFDPVDGNCQPKHTYKFSFTYQNENELRIIYNGMPSEYLEGWTADFCDSCLISLGHWLKNEKL